MPKYFISYVSSSEGNHFFKNKIINIHPLKWQRVNAPSWEQLLNWQKLNDDDLECSVRLPNELERQVSLLLEIMEDRFDVEFLENENNDLKKRIKFEIKECLKDLKDRANYKERFNGR